MGARILRGIGLVIGGLVLSLLAFLVVYLVGYGLYAIFSHSGMQSGAARGIGAAIAAVAAIALLAIYFLGRRSRRLQEQQAGRHAGGKRAA